ncbi:MAG: hypothetical protein ABI114_00485 [Rhodanobacter sp.]
MGKSTWIIEVEHDGVRMTRLNDGKPCENYPKMTHRKAAVYAVAITQGIQPPRDLLECDGPLGKTQSEASLVRVV